MMTLVKMSRYSARFFLRQTPDYSSKSAKHFSKLIEQTNTNTLVLAHEVCLTGFDYKNLEKLLVLSEYATEELLSASVDKTVVLSMLEK
ncbi:MAG: hypothetical protein Q9M40_01445 [Sulfurimonas sp.]|nr:hypothetical protein [Sulfurimonas sp.]